MPAYESQSDGNGSQSQSAFHGTFLGIRLFPCARRRTADRPATDDTKRFIEVHRLYRQTAGSRVSGVASIKQFFDLASRQPDRGGIASMAQRRQRLGASIPGDGARPTSPGTVAQKKRPRNERISKPARARCKGMRIEQEAVSGGRFGARVLGASRLLCTLAQAARHCFTSSIGSLAFSSYSSDKQPLAGKFDFLESPKDGGHIELTAAQDRPLGVPLRLGVVLQMASHTSVPRAD